MVDILNPQDILLKSISINEQNNGPDKEVYFYHGDHLGSANWITDADGKPIQYIHYAPYGELIANQQTIGYDERYKFTGKERDWEAMNANRRAEARPDLNRNIKAAERSAQTVENYGANSAQATSAVVSKTISELNNKE